MGDHLARHGHAERNLSTETKPTVEIDPQQLSQLLHDDDGPSPGGSHKLAHTRRRGAPVPPWEEWDDAGPHFAAEVAPERTDIATIAMRPFRAQVASTIDPPNRRRSTTAPSLHRHGVVTMPPLSALAAPDSSSSTLQPPPEPAPEPAAAYSYQPHLARVQRVPEDQAPRFARASEPTTDHGDWVVLVTSRIHTEAIDPRDIVDSHAAPETVVQTVRIPDIAGLVAAADAHATAAEVHVAAAEAPADAMDATPVAIDDAIDHAIDQALGDALDDALDDSLDDALDDAPAAVNAIPEPEPPPAPVPAVVREPDPPELASFPTRSVEIPIISREPADAAYPEPSIIVAADASALATLPTPSLQMWPLASEPAPEPSAEQVIALALRDLVALDAALPRGHTRPITTIARTALAAHPARRMVRVRHVAAALATLMVVLAALYALASVIF